MTQIDLEDLPRPQAPKTALRTRAGERLVSDLIGTGGQAPAQPVRPSPAQEPSGLRRRWRAFKRWMWRFAPDAVVTKRSYRHRFGRDLDLENPQGLSEKIQWLKLNGMTPLHSRCSDKIAVRDYVAERVGSEILDPHGHGDLRRRGDHAGEHPRGTLRGEAQPRFRARWCSAATGLPSTGRMRAAGCARC